MKICREKPNVVKISSKYRARYTKLLESKKLFFVEDIGHYALIYDIFIVINHN
jgi:hypothetical protein